MEIFRLFQKLTWLHEKESNKNNYFSFYMYSIDIG